MVCSKAMIKYETGSIIIKAYKPFAQEESSFSVNNGRNAKTTDDSVPAWKGAKLPFESNTEIIKKP